MASLHREQIGDDWHRNWATIDRQQAERAFRRFASSVPRSVSVAHRIEKELPGVKNAIASLEQEAAATH
jgi:hypothetical protein